MKNRFRKFVRNKKRLSPLKVDPTRTVTLRRAFVTQLRRKFARLRLAIYDLIVKEDAFGLGERKPYVWNRLTTNERWRFRTSPEKLQEFQKWLKTQVQAYLVGMTDEELWQRYVEQGFQQGAGRAFNDTQPQRKWGAGEGAFYAGTKDQFLRSSFGRPENADKVKLLASRSFDEMEGMTTDMATKMSRALADGLTQGKGPVAVARDISNQLGISRTRAETIAQTELIRAHAEGQLMAMEEMGVEEIGVMVEWNTADDDRVCPLCDAMQGVVLKIEEAKGMIPRHPRCRCAFFPANVGEDTDNQKRGKSRVQAAVRVSAKMGRDDFSTAVPVSKDRLRSILNSLKQFSQLLSRV